MSQRKETAWAWWRQHRQLGGLSNDRLESLVSALMVFGDAYVSGFMVAASEVRPVQHDQYMRCQEYEDGFRDGSAEVASPGSGQP